MAIEVLEIILVPPIRPRPSRVLISSAVDVASGIWQFAEPSRVEVAGGGIIEWVFDGLSPGDRPLIRLEGVARFGDEEPVFLDPFFQTLEEPTNGIVGRVFREARGSYRYNVDVARGGARIPLRCTPARMGGIDVSGPPVRGG